MTEFSKLPHQIPTLLPELIALRREIHRFPELGYQEYATAKRILNALQGLDLELQPGIVDTGIVGVIEGNLPGPTVLLRADMDALPIQESNDHSFVSQNPGVMHACGHDGHTAILVGAVKILHAMRQNLPGRIKFLFQPAEEEARQRPTDLQPVSAASQVIELGVLDGVDAVLGLHLWPDLPVGAIGIKPGAAMGGSSWFRITLHGKSAHAARPQQGLDTITAVANLINMLQLVVTRSIDPGVPVLLNVGTLQGGYRRNVVADRVELTGTVRALDQYLLDVVFKERINDVLEGLSLALGINHNLEYYSEVPVLMNDNRFGEAVYERLNSLPSETNVTTLITNENTLTGEDFAFYTQRRPGLFLYLGCTDPSTNTVIPLHNPKFNFDENAIGIGVMAMVEAAVTLLTHKKKGPLDLAE
jgi:amidohydrolase